MVAVHEETRSRRSTRLPHWISMISWLGVIGITAYRLTAASQATFPGHADRAFYFTTAKNIAGGDGFDINYIFHYLVDQPSLTHYAFDHWLPGGSFANALGIYLLGPEVSSALFISTLSAMGLAIATYLACRQLGLDEPYPSVSALTVAILLPVTTWAVQSEPVLLYSAAAVGALVAITRARTSQRTWLWAGAGIGLAHAIRTDGLILLATGGLVCFLWREDFRRFLQNAGLLIGTYLLVMAPVLVMNWNYLGSPLPTTTVGFVWVTSYEDIYSANPIPVPSLGEALATRLENVGEMVLRLAVELGPNALIVLGALALTALLYRLTSSPRRAVPPLFVVAGIYLAVLVFVHGLVVPAAASGGTWEKTFPSWLPFVVVGAIGGLALLPNRSRLITSLLLGGFLIITTLGLPDATEAQIAENNAVADPLVAMGPTLASEESCLSQEVIVMTRDPWEYSELTGRPSLQIPNDDLGTIFEVADRYQATHLALPAPRESLRDREALIEDLGFEPVGFFEGWELLRFPDSSRLADC